MSSYYLTFNTLQKVILIALSGISRGGEPEYSNEENPIVVYNTSGFYDIVLTAENEFGSNIVNKRLLLFIINTTSVQDQIGEDIYNSAYPNPFTTSTTIEYELNQPEQITLTIYDYLGKQVYQTQENQPQGKQQLKWNAEGYADGLYYYRLQIGGAVANGKMVKVR